jgi:hypothetical protein
MGPKNTSKSGDEWDGNGDGKRIRRITFYLFTLIKYKI